MAQSLCSVVSQGLSLPILRDRACLGSFYLADHPIEALPGPERTHASCTGRQILHHRVTGEAPH